MMRVFTLLFRQSWPLMTAALVVGLLSGASGTGLIALINRVLDAETPRTDLLAGAFVGLCLLRFASSTLSQHFFHRLAQGVAYRLRTNLGRQILSAPLKQLEQIGPARLLAVLTTDISSLIGAFVALPTVLMDLAIVLSCLVYLGWLSLPLLGAFLAFVAIGIITYQLPLSWGYSWFRTHRRRQDDLFSHFEAITRGTKELKLHHERRRSFMDDLLANTARRLRSSAVTAGMIFGAVASWGQLLLVLFIGLMIFVLPGPLALEPRVIRDATLLILFLSGSLQNVVASVPNLSVALVSIRNIEKLGFSPWSTPPEPPPIDDGPTDWRRLDFAGVTYSYTVEDDGRPFAVGPINLSIDSGQLIFIVGGNGSGKTTLAKLLTGLYEPEEGELRLDGRPIDSRSREAYRQLFSAVFWDFHLFRELPGLDRSVLDERAQGFLEKLQLEKKVEILDGKLSQTDLSQGQMKRLALLTAYLEDRPIYLFDEWAADQDPSFKEIFYRQLLPELKARGKTLFVISHDDRYFDAADRIVKLEDGQITADITPPRRLSAAERREIGLASPLATFEPEHRPT